MPNKYVYFFGGKKAEGKAEMKNLLGGKGANLAEMTNIGLPVPPGFTITTEVCTYYYDNRQTYPKSLAAEVETAMAKVERAMGSKFGDPKNPLLVSVRSGARASMPGMMDTILNLGLNDGTVEGLIAKTGNARFAWDCYRRFVQMYGDVVLGLKPVHKDEIDPFEEILESKKHAQGRQARHRADRRRPEGTGRRVQDSDQGQAPARTSPRTRWSSSGARSAPCSARWNNDRAIVYRKHERHPRRLGHRGQRPVDGLRQHGRRLRHRRGLHARPGHRRERLLRRVPDQRPGRGRGRRHPHAAADRQAQGRQSRASTTSSTRSARSSRSTTATCRTSSSPSSRASSHAADPRRQAHRLRRRPDRRRHGRREADRRGKRPCARSSPTSSTSCCARSSTRPRKQRPSRQDGCWPRASTPAPAPPPAASVFNAEDAEAAGASSGEKVILVRIETTPEDIRGMDAAEGILTARGGMTSHAALVARQMGKVCVAGCGELEIDYAKRHADRQGHDASRKATGSRSTAPPARCSRARSPPSRPRSSRC